MVQTTASVPAAFANPLSQGAPNIPPLAVNADGPPPPPDKIKQDPRYHGHVFRATQQAGPIGGWTVDRARAAIELHDQGIFFESWILAAACTRYAPILAALRQRVAPVLGLPRIVTGGTRGLPRLVREEIEAQVAPKRGAMPSPYMPPALWGGTAINLALMGFSIWQHTYGDVGPDGTKPCYTTLWPAYSATFNQYRNTFQANTWDGPVDVVDGDGKWSVIGTGDKPHQLGAVRAIGLEYLAGAYAQNDRASYANRHGDPKPVGIMPPDVGPNDDSVGDAFFQALQTLTLPGAVAGFPHGSQVEMLEASAKTMAIFEQILANTAQHIAMALLGSDGTMSSGTGVYKSPTFDGVRMDFVRDDTESIARAVNSGRNRPWCQVNYGESLSEKDVPILTLPLPDIERDARTKSFGERMLQLHATITAEKLSGCEVTQDRVNEIALGLDVPAPKLAASTEIAGTVAAANPFLGNKGAPDARPEPVTPGNEAAETDPALAPDATATGQADGKATAPAAGGAKGSPKAEKGGGGVADDAAKRLDGFNRAIAAEKLNGFDVGQDRVNELAALFDVPPPKLAGTTKGAEIYAYHVSSDTVARDEARQRLALPPLPDGAGSIERFAAKLNAQTSIVESAADTAAEPPPEPEPGPPVDGPPAPSEEPAEPA